MGTESPLSHFVRVTGNANSKTIHLTVKNVCRIFSQKCIHITIPLLNFFLITHILSVM